MAGRNRFSARGARSLSEKADRFSSGTCVFISHQFADTAMANQIGEELQALEIDIWIDTQDAASQQASAANSDKKLAEAIEWGLINCTHLLALISPKTKGSWWVPFEIGSVRGRGKPLAFFVHKDVTQLPAWLTLGTKLLDQIDFYRWATGVSPYKTLTETKARAHKGARWSHIADLLPNVRTH